MSKARLLKRLKGFTIGSFRYILLICLSFMILYPLLRMIANAIVHLHVIGSVGAFWIPPIPSFDNFIVAFHVMNFTEVFLFTMANITIVMVLQIVNSALAGYAFARLKFRGSGILFFFVILTIVVPMQALFLPQFILFARFDVFGLINLFTGSPLNLLNQTEAIFIMAALGQGISGGLFIFIFRQFFRGLPKELEEAAYVDGAGVIRTFLTIVMPMAKPGLLTVGTLSFIWNWNDNFFPTVFNNTDLYMRVRIANLNRPSPAGTSTMQQAIDFVRYRIPHDTAILTTPVYDATIANVTNILSIVPLIILFLLVQKQFVEGVERSGIVG